MGFRNKLELSHDYAEERFRTAFQDFFALRLFLVNSMVPRMYEPPPEIDGWIVETTAGRDALQVLAKTAPEIPAASRKLGLFNVFAHDVPLVDLDASDKTGIASLLSAEAASGRRRFPWVYERTLYDKFAQLFPNKTRSLTSDETELLLDGTPQGVFQLQTWIIGSFGLLLSSESRQLDPMLSAPLWHCSDPACRSLHEVTLEVPKSADRRAATMIRGHFNEITGPRSEWNGYFGVITRAPGEWYDHLRTASLPWLLVNAFAADELRLLLTGLLNRTGALPPRNLLPAKCRVGSAEAIVAQLTSSEVFQLLLVGNDRDIISVLESLVDSKEIEIPATELRTTIFSAASPGWFNTVAQCSRLGVRFYSHDERFPMRHLKSIAERVYLGDIESASLNWKLRHIRGDPDTRLLTYLYETDPVRIVTELFLDTPEHLMRLFAELRFGALALPSSATQELDLIRRILWKIGFGSYSFPDANERFWNRLRALEAAARATPVADETDKERIRSAGVNLFVSLEEILDASLSFIAWALLADHYSNTKFRYNLEEARTFMAKHLNAVSGSGAVVYDPAGKNTLYPLIVGFKSLASVCSQYLQKSDADYVRDEREYPGYSSSLLQPFVCRHRIFMLDLHRSDVLRLIDVLQSITSALTQAEAASVRNRIDHQRSDFPSSTEIIDCCSRISGAVREMETLGIVPLLYVRQSHETDAAGRGTMRFVAYNGQQHVIRWPQVVDDEMPGPNLPIAIIPGVRIRGSSEAPRFRIQEASPYVKRWADYPIRRERIHERRSDAAANTIVIPASGQVSEIAS